MRPVLLVWSLAVLYGIHPGNVQARDSIELLGGLSWEDTFTEVVIKLNHINTITEIYIEDESHNYIDLKGMYDKYSILKRVSGIFNKNTTKYDKKSGRKFYDDTILLVAHAVPLFGIDFSVVLAFTSKKYMMSDKIYKLDILMSDNNEYYLPMRMMHVVFSKHEDTVFNGHAANRLKEYVYRTYANFARFGVYEDEFRVEDEDGRVFFVRFKPSEVLAGIAAGYTGSCVIQYRNNALTQRPAPATSR